MFDDRINPGTHLLRRRELAHQRQHLDVVIINISERGALLTRSSDRATAIQIRIEAWMLWALSPPPHAADL